MKALRTLVKLVLEIVFIVVCVLIYLPICVSLFIMFNVVSLCLYHPSNGPLIVGPLIVGSLVFHLMLEQFKSNFCKETL